MNYEKLIYNIRVLWYALTLTVSRYHSMCKLVDRIAYHAMCLRNHYQMAKRKLLKNIQIAREEVKRYHDHSST